MKSRFQTLLYVQKNCQIPSKRETVGAKRSTSQLTANIHLYESVSNDIKRPETEICQNSLLTVRNLRVNSTSADLEKSRNELRQRSIFNTRDVQERFASFSAVQETEELVDQRDKTLKQQTPKTYMRQNRPCSIYLITETYSLRFGEIDKEIVPYQKTKALRRQDILKFSKETLKHEMKNERTYRY